MIYAPNEVCKTGDHCDSELPEYVPPIDLPMHEFRRAVNTASTAQYNQPRAFSDKVSTVLTLLIVQIAHYMDVKQDSVYRVGQGVADTEKTLRIHTEFLSSQFFSLPC